MAGKLNHKDSGLKYWCLSEKALTYFTELVITSNGSDPAPTKTRWVPSKDSTSGSPDSWCQKDTIISHDTTVPRQRGDIYIVALVTTLQAYLQLIISVPLKNSTEWPLQYWKEDSVHPRLLGAIAGELRSIGALNDQELCLEGDITAWRAHPLRHPPHLEPESAHEPLVPAHEHSVTSVCFFFSFSSWTKFLFFCTQYFIFAFQATRQEFLLLSVGKKILFQITSDKDSFWPWKTNWSLIIFFSQEKKILWQ